MIDNQAPEPEETLSETSDTSTFVIESLVNATALAGLLADPRWANFIEPALNLVQARAAKRASRVPLTMDGTIQATYWRGQHDGIEEFRRTLSRLRHLADRIIAEARSNRPV